MFMRLRILFCSLILAFKSRALALYKCVISEGILVFGEVCLYGFRMYRFIAFLIGGGDPHCFRFYVFFSN